jgi:HAD superfamily hydrolase (TIGR01450 family)
MWAEVERPARAVLFDIDGVLTIGMDAVPGAAMFVRSLGERIVLVSNNSAESPIALARRLALFGIDIDPRRIVLAGWEACEVVAERIPQGRVAAFATAELRAYLCTFGLRAADDGPADAVLVARHRTFDLAALERLAGLALEGTPVIAANPDLWHPGRAGSRVPETGAIVAALKAVVPSAEVTFVGKPEPRLFQTALRRVGATAAEAVMIGDNPATDGDGARRAGLAWIPFDAATGDLTHLVEAVAAMAS